MSSKKAVQQQQPQGLTKALSARHLDKEALVSAIAAKMAYAFGTASHSLQEEDYKASPMFLEEVHAMLIGLEVRQLEILQHIINVIAESAYNNKGLREELATTKAKYEGALEVLRALKSS